MKMTSDEKKRRQEYFGQKDEQSAPVAHRVTPGPLIMYGWVVSTDGGVSQLEREPSASARTAFGFFPSSSPSRSAGAESQ